MRPVSLSASIVYLVGLIAATSGLSIAAATPVQNSPPTEARDDAVIVVRILSSTSPFWLNISGRESTISIAANNNLSLPADAGTRLQVRSRSGYMELSGSGADHLDDKTALTSVSITADGDGVLEIQTESLRRAYRGRIQISVDEKEGVLIIYNQVEVEEYVASVVASEYGLKDEEGAKAMAVVARTYAMRAQQNEKTRTSFLDDTRSQVYRGFDSTTTRSRRAANGTAGQTIEFNGQLIEAVYSSSNGGLTAANESIWAGAPIPYLRPRIDPYDAISPHSNWDAVLNKDRLHSALSDRYNMTVTSLQFGGQEKDGRIRTVTLKQDRGDERQISGSSFRAIAGGLNSQLKSTFFKVKERGRDYQFEGQGFGHGVGMSQWGAHGMALQGSEYDDILNFYYPGTSLRYPTDIPALAGDMGLARGASGAVPSEINTSGTEGFSSAASPPTITQTQIKGWAGRQSVTTRTENKRRRIGW